MLLLRITIAVYLVIITWAKPKCPTHIWCTCICTYIYTLQYGVCGYKLYARYKLKRIRGVHYLYIILCVHDIYVHNNYQFTTCTLSYLCGDCVKLMELINVWLHWSILSGQDPQIKYLALQVWPLSPKNFTASFLLLYTKYKYPKIYKASVLL